MKWRLRLSRHLIQLKNRLSDYCSHPISWILLLVIFIRLYACLTTYIVNPDGVHYIYQARAIYYGQWSKLTACHLNYISVLPFLIASSFAVVRDWIIAGRMVTFVFSTATLIPLFFILKRFLNKTACHLTVLVYAFIPVLVNRTSDVVRGPIFWFFLCLGMLYFVRQWDGEHQDRYQKNLVLSCLCFLLATWTRTEGAYAIIVSWAYLLLTRSDHRFRRVLTFSIPIVLIIAAGATSFALIDTLAGHHLRLDRIVGELTQFIPTYQALRGQLKDLISQNTDWMAEFLRHVRTLVWFMPLSIIFNYIWESFFYPFALIYFIGFIGIRQRLQSNRHIAYFLWLSIFGLAVLYIHLLTNWLIFHRFMVILILPGCIFIGFGIDNIIDYIKRKFRMRHGVAAGVMVALIILSGLPKNLIHREKDKYIYQQAGQIIAQQKSPEQICPILASYSTEYVWVFFYGHLGYPGPLCARNYGGTIPKSYKRLLAKLKKMGWQYVLYEEKSWQKAKFDLMQTPYQSDFDILGRWWHRDVGNLVLLKLKSAHP